MDISCLIIAYARSANVESLIRDLHLQGVNRFYIAIDGAKTSQVENIQQDLIARIKFLSESLPLSVDVWHRKTNLGIAVSVVSGIDWFFSKEEFGLIIEDDLKVSSDFVKFIRYGITLRNQNIIMLSGNRFLALPEKSILSSYPATWGWATWKTEWVPIRENVINFPKIKMRLLMSWDYQFWLLGALRVYSGSVDTWDIPIALYMKNESKYSLLPPKNLVSNIGADDFANHTLTDNFPIGIPVETLDDINLDNSKLVTKHYDKQLMSQVYKIKFKHLLLLPYLLIACLRSVFERNTLNRRIGGINFEN